MPRADYHRQPRLTALRCYYQEGVAARDGSACPYDPPRASGDTIRARLWTQGREDDDTIRTVEELV